MLSPPVILIKLAVAIEKFLNNLIYFLIEEGIRRSLLNLKYLLLVSGVDESLAADFETLLEKDIITIIKTVISNIKKEFPEKLLKRLLES
jgi:hypothetical protein